MVVRGGRVGVRCRSGGWRWLAAWAVAGAGLVAAFGAAWAAGVFAPPSTVSAAVEHGVGFSGSVDGYRSWYGSYRLGEVGEVWCVDHGIAAPDVVLGYAPTSLEDRAPETRRAVAWAVGRNGVGADRVTAAALMLVVHDLMGAVYPSGPLSVDRLTEADLTGFEGAAATVLERARAMKADAVSRAGLIGPLSMIVTTDGEGTGVAGRPGTLRATVVDVAGVPLAGVAVHPDVVGAELQGDVDRTTGEDGTVSWTFVSGPGENRFALTADVPGAELVALRPTAGAAQRVARPAGVLVGGASSFEAKVPRTFTILKLGDEPSLAVAGARFTMSGVDGELVVGPDGRTPPVTVLPGTYTVTEVASPPGYDGGGPWQVVVADADVVLEAHNRARRGELVVSKVDAVTGEPVAGASFAVAADRDADPSTFEVPVLDPSAPLLVGRYEVREITAPAHHRRSDVPVVVEVRAGERTAVVVPNQPLATVAFAKRPPLGGATFAIRREGGDEVGRCTTGPDGRCVLPPDVLDAHARYCWTEVEAPSGWGLADGSCFTAGPAGSVTTIDVEEPPLPPPPAPPTPAPPAPPVEAVRPVEAAPPVETASPPAEAEVPTVVLSGPPATAPELPRTGVPAFRVAGLGLALLGLGVVLSAAAVQRR